jgi:choloylglycine hydrolase
MRKLTAFFLLAATMASSLACTRILWNNNQYGVLVARSMDWPESTEPSLWFLPRGMDRDGSRCGSETVVKENPLQWTSKYASVVVAIYGIGTVDGINEKGLGGHLLYLSKTDFGPRDAGKKGVSAILWLQYVLDQATTVKEALDLLKNVQPVLIQAHGYGSTIHLALEDKTGDSAIIEYLGGKAGIHHGRQYTIMTNDPPYDEQLALLAKMDFSKPGQDTPVPGNISARDRFQRATYFSKFFPEPKDMQEAFATILAAIRSVSVPFGTPYHKLGDGLPVYNTEYRTVADLTHGVYGFELTTTPNFFWVKLADFRPEKGQPALCLTPGALDLAGDVTAQFRPAPPPF